MSTPQKTSASNEQHFSLLLTTEAHNSRARFPTMFRILFFFAALLSQSVVSSFTTTTSTPLSSTTTRPLEQKLQQSKLSEIDELCIENVAEFCLKADNKINEGCDVDEYQALVNQLLDQRQQLSKHVDYIDELLAKLECKGLADAAAKEEENSYFAG